MKEYSFIIGEQKYSVKDENELSLILKLTSDQTNISNILHWNIIMELDKNLEKTIVSYKGLLNCLKYLNEKNSFLFLIKIGDILVDIIQESKKLGEILAIIPEEANKMRLLKQLRTNGLLKLIKTTKDIGNVIEWIFGENEKKFIELIGEERIREIFLATYEINIILYYLEDKNKDYLINIIGLEGITKKIKNSDNLCILLKGLTDKKAKELLKLLDKKNILNLFSNDYDFHNFLIKIPKNKEKILLNHLTK